MKMTRTEEFDLSQITEIITPAITKLFKSQAVEIFYDCVGYPDTPPNDKPFVIAELRQDKVRTTLELTVGEVKDMVAKAKGARKDAVSAIYGQRRSVGGVDGTSTIVQTETVQGLRVTTWSTPTL